MCNNPNILSWYQPHSYSTSDWSNCTVPTPTLSITWAKQWVSRGRLWSVKRRRSASWNWWPALSQFAVVYRTVLECPGVATHAADPCTPGTLSSLDALICLPFHAFWQRPWLAHQKPLCWEGDLTIFCTYAFHFLKEQYTYLWHELNNQSLS